MDMITTAVAALTTAEWIYLAVFGAAPAAIAALCALAAHRRGRPRQLIADTETEAARRRADR